MSSYKMVPFILMFMISTPVMTADLQSSRGALFSSESSPLIINDAVERLIEIDSGFKVLLEEHAAIYYLLKSNGDFENILIALRKSQESGTAVSFEVDPTYLKILSLRKSL